MGSSLPIITRSLDIVDRGNLGCCHWCACGLLLPTFGGVTVAGAAALAAARRRPRLRQPAQRVMEDCCNKVWGVLAPTLRRSLRVLALRLTLHSLPWCPSRPSSTLTEDYARLGSNQDVCLCHRWDNQLSSLLRGTLEVPCLNKSIQENIPIGHCGMSERSFCIFRRIHVRLTWASQVAYECSSFTAVPQTDLKYFNLESSLGSACLTGKSTPTGLDAFPEAESHGYLSPPQ